MTTADTRFQYRLEFLRGDSTADQSPIATLPIEQVDWKPALECAKWTSTLAQPCRPIVLDTVGGVIEPSWHPEYGRPYINGVEVTFPNGASTSAGAVIPITFFKAAATAASATLVEEGKLANGEHFRYRVCAYERDAATPREGNGAGNQFTVEAAPRPLDVVTGNIQDFLDRAELTQELTDDAMPVFIPRALLAEVIDLTTGAGRVETGGVLVGHVRLDENNARIFLEVTAQISAVHAEQELTSLTLTPQTWAAVDAAVAIRGRAEIYLGWWHSHPVKQWCADCPEEKRRKCRLTGEFFSADDIAVHRCCFSRGFHVALVVSEAYATGVSTALYGWRGGMVMRREFHVLDDEPTG